MKIPGVTFALSNLGAVTPPIKKSSHRLLSRVRDIEFDGRLAHARAPHIPARTVTKFAACRILNF
jgi:hypothetical protein